MKYNVVVSIGLTELEKCVNILLQGGWVCQGGVCYLNQHSGRDYNTLIDSFAQAMIKDDANE